MRRGKRGGNYYNNKPRDLFDQAINNEQTQNTNTGDKNDGYNNYEPNYHYNKNKGNPFAKDTHKNQQYKKREYTKKVFKDYVPEQKEEKREEIIVPEQENAEYKRLQLKILDIELRQEDEQNKEKIDEMRELMRTQDYSEHKKELDRMTEKKQISRDENVILSIIRKNQMIMQNPDIITNIIEILCSHKDNVEIQQDFLDLLGFDELELISELIQNRAEIMTLVNIAKTALDETEKMEKGTASKNLPNAGITIEDPGFAGYGRRKTWTMLLVLNILQIAQKVGCHTCLISHEDSPTTNAKGEVLHIGMLLGSDLPDKAGLQMTEIWNLVDIGSGRRIMVRPARLKRPIKTRMFLADTPEFDWQYNQNKPDPKHTVAYWYDQWAANNYSKIPLPK